MIYTAMTAHAMRLAYAAHHGQTDKSGLPYIAHPIHLAEQMTDELTCTVALLHDVVEDTPWTLDQLRAEGFPSAVIDALSLLTHADDTPYLDYVRRIKGNAIARAVKLADLAHNSDLTRLATVTPRDRARVEKYRVATALLMSGVSPPNP